MIVGPGHSAAAAAPAPAALPGRDALLALEPGARRAVLAESLRVRAAAALGAAAEAVDPDRPLASLGLDSLAALELKGDVEAALGVELPLAELLAGSGTGQLTDLLLASLAAGRAEAPAAPPAEDDGRLSAGQKALWFLERLAPGGAYNIAVAARVRGGLDAAALRRALAALVDRHAALRTVFPSADGEPERRVLDRIEIDLAAEAWSERRLAEEAYRPFSLERGPLLRVRLLGPVLLLSVHHLVADFTSLAVLARDLAALYRGEPLPPPAAGYADFVRWQERMLAGPRGERLRAYWLEALAGVPDLDLPADRPRPPVKTWRGVARFLELPSGLADGVRALGASRGATLFTTLLAAFQAQLGRASGQRDFAVGAPTAGRGEPAHAGIVGYLVNPVALRADLAGDPGFLELLDRVRRTAFAGLAHADFPFALLVERLRPERDPARSPIFQTLLALQRPRPGEPADLALFALGEEGGRLDLGGLELQSLRLAERRAQFDLTLRAAELPSGGLGLALEADADLFDAATAGRMLGHLATLLAGAVADPRRALSALPLLTPAERRQVLVDWSAGPALAAAPGLLHRRFEQQAARLPEAAALVAGAEVLTYGELNRRANRLARRLQSRGVGPEVRVGVGLGRSAELVVALLAVLKAGGAYVPLDPSYPAERLAWMAADAGAEVVITEPWAEAGAAGGDGSDLAPAALLENLAYLIYTSGSTGRPKAVAIEHRNAAALVAWALGVFAPQELAGVLAATSIAFDLSVFELFVPLSAGGRVLMAENALELPRLPAAAAVTLVNTVPSALAELARAGGLPPAVRTVNLAGEPVPPALAEAVARLPGVERLYNLYGPSEDTTYSTFGRLTAGRPVTIGRPLDGRRAYLLDAALEPVPAGIPGELCLTGAGLARGYLGRPELTAERFVPDPWSGEPGARLYRTGDLARWLPDGEIDFLGRLDHQVKVRGFRIETGEVEAALARHPAVGAAVVTAREDGEAGRRLVAYVVPRAGGEVPAAELRVFLGRTLPEYMIPSVFVSLAALPLSPTGKVDRKALPAPAPAAPPPEAGPESPAEELLAGVFAEVLGVERVGCHDDFFDLGGHSLLATRVAARAGRLLGVDLPVGAVFRAPTVAGLAAQLAGAPPASPPLRPVPRDGRGLPLSFAQQRLWFLDRLEPGSAAYNLPGAVRLDGPLDLPALAASLAAAGERHEALRTVVRADDGETRQLVAAPALALPVADLSELPPARRAAEARRLAEREARAPFDLARGPVCRARLVRLSAAEHLLLVTLHHIAADGWSLGILLRELAAGYAALAAGRSSLLSDLPDLPDLPVQYADYAVWQRAWLRGEVLAGELDYWRRRLAGLPVLELPADRPRPALRDLRGAVRTLAQAPELAAAAGRLARRQGTTLFMAVLGVFQALLARVTAEEVVAVGSPVANRRRVEVEGLIGFFVNTLVLDARVGDDPPFAGLLARVREACLGAYAHQDLPFERLVEELHPGRDLARNPLFQVMLVLEEPLPAVRAGGLSLAPRRVENGTAKLDLTLAVTPLSDGGWLVTAEHATALFDAATVGRLLGHFRTLLAGACADPSRRLSELPLLAAAERHQVLAAWNDTRRDLPRGLCLHDLVAAQAARTPAAPAVVAGAERLTYEELERRAGRLARRLRTLGVGPEVRVGVRLGRTADLVVALLAVLKAGGAYVPVDPRHPRERQELMLADAGARVVISPEGITAAGGRGPAPAVAVLPGNLAYLIYTSGSTGRPKAVAIEHQSAVALVHWALEAYSPADLAGVLFATSVGFDLSVFEVFVPLAAGGRVVVAEDALELPRLAAAGEVTLVNSVPSALAELAGGPLPAALRVVNLAGEPLREELVERLHAHPQVERVYNLYGPSEDTTYSTFTRARPGRSVTIGRPLAGRRAYVVGRRGEPLPAGVPGELWLGGAGLARGYLNRPELTAERFVPDPFGDGPGARLYRTGDLVRRRPDGELQFLGRIDHQVKIRGVRIEPGEVEAALARHPGVRQAAVLALPEPGGAGLRLAAYLALAAGIELDAAALRTWLRERLPEAFVPTAWMALPALPLLPNGKVDRRALARLEPGVGPPPAAGAAPRTPLEAALARAAAEVLGRTRVGIHDDFFDLGGHSLLATRLVSRLARTLGADLPVSAVFQAPTVAALAGRVAAAGAPEAPPLQPVRRPHEGREDLPLSFAQQRLWFLDRLQPGTAAYNMPGAVELTGPLDAAALAAALDEVRRRHEILRTVFPVRGGGPVQLVRPAAPAVLPVIDLGGLPAAVREAQAERLAAEEARTPFDLARGPVLRVVLLRLGERAHRLLVNLHHAVADGWSLGLLLREAADLYAGAPPPELPVQYADHALWQRGWLQGEALARQLAWWRERLADLPVLELPADRPRPAVRDLRGAVRALALPPGLADGAARLARREGATPFMTLLAAFQALLARWTGEAVVPVGSPVANRRPVEAEPLIGLFVNTLVLPVRLGDDPPFGDLLARVREVCLGAYAHQDLPFERLVEELHPGRDLAQNPLFQVAFQLEEPLPSRRAGDLVLAARRIDNGTAKFDLALAVVPLPEGGWLARAEHAAALFEPGTVDRLLEHFRTLLGGAAAEPSRRLSDLPLLGAAERAQLLAEWSAGPAAELPAADLVRLLAERAARAPGALAVSSPAGRLTYGELAARAGRIAAGLRALGVGPEVVVGLHAPRSPELVMGALAVLQAGGAYLPLDPSYPEERLAFMAAEAAIPVLLTTAAGRPGWIGAGVRAVALDAEPAAVAAGDPVAALPASTAYVLYTSGSTGRPKGVQVPRAGLANLVRWHLRTYGVTEHDRATLVASPAFDASVWEMWPYLAAGASLHVPDEDTRLAPERLCGWLDAEGVTHCFLPTALAEQLLDLLERGAAPPAALRALLTGGDRLRTVPARPLPFALVNHYGPTENSVVATWGEVAPPAPPRSGSRPPSIGRPVDGVRAYVLGPHGEPVPAGAAGELHLGGTGLARGYLGRPEATAEGFVPDPFGAGGGRLYRTGDRVRFLADGRLEFLGRLDAQVKLRGVRIEPGEIEATLLRHPGVREAAAVVRTDGGTPRLVAYVAPMAGEAPAAADLRAFLRRRLPEAMVPAAWVLLPALPLSASGKVDRRALPPPGPEAGEERAPTAPRTPVEERLAALWSEVLGIERVGVEDDFFELGGHSLSAVRTTFRIAEALGVEVPVSVLFQNSTVAALAAWLESGGARPAACLPPAARDAETGRAFPLSLAQQRLWLIDRLDPGNPAYNQSVAVRLAGGLRPAALAWSLAEILRRHQPLRTVFREEEGEPVQIVLPPPAGAVLPRLDLSAVPGPQRGAALRQAIRAELARPFDLESGPLARFVLARLAPDEHVLAATFHHIASDGWSMEVFFRELVALYGAAASGRPSPLPELPLSYVDFALWQRRTLTPEVLDGQLAYWRRELSGVPVLELPTDRPRAARAGQRGAAVAFTLAPALLAALRAFGRGEGVTLFASLLAGFMALLARYSGQDDLPVGITSAGRDRRETEGMIGFFVNTLVIRARAADDPDFRSLARQVRERILAAQAHQDVPFERVVEELQPDRDPLHSPLFQVMLTHLNTSRAPLAATGLAAALLAPEVATAKFDLLLTVDEHERGAGGHLEYRTDLFETATAARLLQHLETLLGAAAADPSVRLWDLPLLTAAEREEILIAWNDTRADLPGGLCLHDLVAAQAARTPGAVAVVGSGAQLTYGELERASNRLARQLRGRGVGPEVRVGVRLARTADLVVAVLAVLKAGGAYVPIDPKYPQERQELMLADSGARVLIEDLDGAPGHGDAPLAPLAAPESLAYLIYTSGSTGRPKAVAIEHRSAVTLVQWALGVFPPENLRGVLFATSVCFDLSVFEIFVPLAAGGRVVVAEDALALPGLAAREEVTLVNTVPSAMAELAEGPLPAALRVVNLAGEPVRPELVERIAAHPQVARVYNLYGPSEDTTYSTFTLLRPGAPVTIGRPVANTRAYVVDRCGRPAPVGVPGELWLGGAGLARGYLGRPELTAERFIPDPFGEEAGARLYRTGDLVRWRSDARLQFLGRLDHQVKVRGFRIEPGEIESALLRHPRVAEAAVVVHAGSAEPGDRSLVAYLVPRADAAVPAAHTAEEAARHVGQWQGIWDEAYARGSRSDDGPGTLLDPTFDIQGWNSSYTGEPIPAAEMHEWVDHTVERLLALPHRRILEVGCGTGLLLFRVAPHADLYRATDFSATVLGHLRRFLGDLPQVELERRPADDWRGVEPGALDLVILNSVAQYFPGTDYLARVLEGAVRAVAPGGAVFVGDVRSRPLLEALHLSVALHRAPGALRLAELRQRIGRQVAEEEELVVDPAFFFALARRLPGIGRVQVLLKRGAAVNELTRFRYDVVLHIGAGAEVAGGPPHRLGWGSEVALADLESRLAGNHHDALLLERIPNARLAAEAAALELLAGAGQPSATVADLRREVAARLAGTAAVDPEELWRLADRLGWDAELTWSRRGGTDGLFTALLRRRGTVPSADPLPGLLAAGGLDRPWSAYGNDPMRGELAHDFLPDLRRRLEAELPAPLVPAAFVLLDALPLTPNGKVDRRALARRAPERGSREPYVAPRTPLEESLAGLWNEILGEERTGGRIGVHDNFFELGGHSLIASRLAARVRSTLGLELPLRALFEAPTVAALAERLAGQSAGEAEAIPRQPRPPGKPARFPLSFSQLREWILDRLEPGTPAYNIPSPKRITGPACVPALARALREIVRRHESLRTTFQAGRDGPFQDEPFQVVAPDLEVPLPVADLAGLPVARREPELQRLLAEDLDQGFDLEAGPLLRVRLVRLAAEDHALLLTTHHIVSDGWSTGVLSRELAALYEAFSQGGEARLPELPVQYPDFAVWQRDRLQGEHLEELAGYWRARLAGAPPLLELPTDRPRPAVRTSRGARLAFAWPAAVADPLRALAAESGGSLFMTLLAAFQALLGRLSGQDDVTVGTFTGNRGRTELEGLLGFFINTLALRTDLAGEPSLRELLGRVREVTLGAYAHQEIPFEKLLEALSLPRDPARTPVFQTMLVLHNFPRGRVELSRVTLEPLPYRTHRSEVDLTLWMEERDGGLAGEAEFSRDLFDEATVARLVGSLRRLIEGAVADPGASLWSLPVLAASERAQIVAAWSRTTDEPAGPPLLHRLFEIQAARSPDAVAVETGADGVRLTYAELDARAERLARSLRAAGVSPEARVGLAVERSPEMLVGMLGVLKAGGAYVPLDPAYPRDRLAYMLEDSGAALLLTQERLAGRLPTGGARVILLDVPLPAPGAPPEPAAVHPENAAYVIYTSGSTGRPKGVVVSHRAIAAYARTARQYYAVTAADRVLQLGSISFDTSAEEIYPALTAGAALVLRADAMVLSMAHFLRETGRLGITLLALQTAFWHEIVAGLYAGGELPRSLRLVAFGGEAALVDRLADWRRRVGPHVRLVNTYGPTEATIVSTYRELAEPEDDPEVPIGRAIPGARTYVLDRRFEPVPAGVKGELMIGGVGLARGYLGRPDLTAERFVPDPHAGAPGARLYRTGDLARFRPTGELLFEGRADRQLKLRGYRIEPGEIEAALRQHPALHDAVADLRGHGDDKRLVAWVVPREGQPAPAASELRAFLRDRLPEPMVPSVCLPVAALPLTPSGKVDRRALPEPAAARAELPGYVEPGSALERTVAGIFRDLLRVDRVGLHDNFFDLGGHSLLVVRAHQRLCEALGREIPVVDLFRFPTVALLTRHLGGGQEEKPAFEQVQGLAEQQRAARLRQKQVAERMRRPGGPKR